VVNKTGKELANWPQDSVATAFAAVDVNKQNTQVGGEGQGTYGPFQLWAVNSNASDGSHTLCLIGFDEWGKVNDMCFQVTKDFFYQQAPLAVNNTCDGLSVGMYVWLKSNHSVWGSVVSINLDAQTVTFEPVFRFAPAISGPQAFRPSSTTAPCADVEPGSGPI
jgi:hypothetical protein